MLRIKILRYIPEKNEKYFEEYIIPKPMKVIDAIEYINARFDANISIRYYCKVGKCKSCFVLVNKKPVLACKKIVEKDCTIEPIGNPIKDFVHV